MHRGLAQPECLVGHDEIGDQVIWHEVDIASMVQRHVIPKAALAGACPVHFPGSLVGRIFRGQAWAQPCRPAEGTYLKLWAGIYADGTRMRIVGRQSLGHMHGPMEECVSWCRSMHPISNPFIMLTVVNRQISRQSLL